MMRAKYQHFAIFMLLAIVFSFCIHRDMQIEKQYTGDLRNRIVGARLQKDGKPPYFYKWRPQDGLRYYDPIKLDTTYANAITASPFFHHLLFPIADMQQRDISRIWLAVQYILFVLCMLIAFSFTKNNIQQWTVAFMAALFPFAQAWLTMIAYGQIYIVFPFLAFAFVSFFQRKDNLLFSCLAGLAAAVLFLSRPTTVLFFLPFLFLLKRYSLKYLIVFFLPGLILLCYSFLDQKEKSYWIEYRKAIAAHVQDHQSDDRQARTIAYKPQLYKNWEGWDQDTIDNARLAYPFNIHFEYAGVQEVLKKLFHKKIPYQILNYSFLFIVTVLLIVFVLGHRSDDSLHVMVTAIFGFCLYMMSDLFSPVIRNQYYFVQWAFPLLACAALYDTKLRLVYLFLFAGLLLNVINRPHIFMRYVIGEYLILFTLLRLCLSRQLKWFK